MANVDAGVVIGPLCAVLREGIEGGKEWSYFIDSGTDTALVGTLSKLTAAEASRSLAGSSIVAQVQHITFGLKVSAAWIRGEREGSYAWEESWGVPTADEATWKEMQGKVRAAHAELRQAIEKHALTSAEAIGGAIGAIAHLAYHLGAIRQKVALLRQR